MAKIQATNNGNGHYNSSTITLSDGDECGPQYDVNGNHKVVVSGSVGASTADQSTFTSSSTAGTIAMGVYQTTPDTISDGKAAAARISSRRALMVSLDTNLESIVSGAENDKVLVAPHYRSDSFNTTFTSADASTAATVKAATASKKIYITSVVLSSDAAINLKLQDNAGTPVVAVGPIYMAVNSTVPMNFSTPLQMATNVPLQVKASGAGNISVTVSGYVI